MKARPSNNLVLAYMRDDDLAHDPWGTAMAWAFGVAEVLNARSEDVPEELEFQPSPFVRTSTEQPEEYPDSEVWRLLHDGEVTSTDLQFAGRCLARYLDWCRTAGRDY